MAAPGTVAVRGVEVPGAAEDFLVVEVVADSGDSEEDRSVAVARAEAGETLAGRNEI